MKEDLEPIKDINRIPVSILRQALEDSEFGTTMASSLLGWGKDSTRLRASLGLRKNRKGGIERYVPYDLAVKMIKSWNLDPVDYGI